MPVAQVLTLTQRRDARPGAGLTTHPDDNAHRVRPTHTVSGYTAVRLQVLHRTTRAGPENAVDATAIEAQTRQTRLEVGHVITAQVR